LTVVDYIFDAESNKGSITIDMQGQGIEVRHRIVENIGKICSDKNITIIAGEEKRKGGRYRVLNESLINGLLTVEFEASW
jgi:hypothetical protein